MKKYKKCIFKAFHYLVKAFKFFKHPIPFYVATKKFAQHELFDCIGEKII